MKLIRRSLPFMILFLILGLHTAPTFGQTSSNKTPHLAYGQSMNIPLSGKIWLEVEQGDTFTISIFTTDALIAPILESNAYLRLDAFNWKEFNGGASWVYRAEQPGPYLLTVLAAELGSVALERGDKVDIDLGAIAIGDTMTGTCSQTQLEFYSIDLPAGAEMTVHLKGRGAVMLVPSLNGAEVFSRFDSEEHDRHYVIPSALAGVHPIYVQCSAGAYELDVVAGNNLWLDRGPLTLDTPVSGTGTAGYSDRYVVEMQQGDVLTVTIDDPSFEFHHMEGREKNGAYLYRAAEGWTETGFYATFWTQSEGPHLLYVLSNQPYTLSASKGPMLNGVEKVRIGDTVEMSEATETWLVDVPDGSWVTLETELLDFAGLVSIDLLDAAGRHVSPSYIGRHETISRFAFHLEGPAPYRVVTYSLDRFRLTVTEGEQITIDRGEIEVGQHIEETSTYGQFLFYSLQATPSGRPIAITTTGLSNFGVQDTNGEWVQAVYFLLDPTVPSEDRIRYEVYLLDGRCPCQLGLQTEQANYSIEVMPIAPDVFPAAQALNLGEAVSGDTGEALILPYTFQTDTEGDLTIRLEFDPTRMKTELPLLDVTLMGEVFHHLDLDNTRTKMGEGYIVQHYPLYFPGQYTLSIKNLYGPYTLTVTLE